MAGLPPLSGFLGKLMVLDAVRTSGLPAAQVWAVWAVVLATSLMALVGFARAGSVVFWNTSPAPGPAAPAAALPFVAVFGLVAGLAALTVFAGPVSGYLSATAAQIHSPAAYVAAVLDGGAR
jgi:multicomponent K+:H+ antiporter subunit D